MPVSPPHALQQAIMQEKGPVEAQIAQEILPATSENEPKPGWAPGREGQVGQVGQGQPPGRETEQSIQFYWAVESAPEKRGWESRRGQLAALARTGTDWQDEERRARDYYHWSRMD